MPLAHWNGLTIFFAHVPKTGGSSVEDYLIKRFGPLSILDQNKRTGVSGTGLIVPSTHLAAEDVRELLPHSLDYSFAVVRDPLTRMESEFRYQTNVSRMSKLGFSTWLRVMLFAVKMEPRIYENHIRPQTDLVPEGSESFRLEDGFDNMIARLDEVTSSTEPELQVGHLLKRERTPIKMSKQDINLIVDTYAADFDRFGYDRPDTANAQNDPFHVARDMVAKVLAWLLVKKQRRDWVR